MKYYNYIIYGGIQNHALTVLSEKCNKEECLQSKV